jgi:predicted ABC-type ATPase
LNVDRVDLRVKKGGHDVPKDKIRDRWHRSLNQLPWFLNEADWALLFDNSDTLRIVGRKRDGLIELDNTAPSALADAVNKINT